MYPLGRLPRVTHKLQLLFPQGIEVYRVLNMQVIEVYKVLKLQVIEVYRVLKYAMY